MKLNRTKQGLSKMEYCMLFQVACYNSSLPDSEMSSKSQKKTIGSPNYQYFIVTGGSTKDSLATNLAKCVEIEKDEMRTEKGNVQTFHPQNLDRKTVVLSELLGFKYEQGEKVNSSIREAYLDSLENDREYMEKVFSAFKSPYFHTFDFDVLRDLYESSQGTYQGTSRPWVSYNYLDTILSVLVALFNYTVMVAYPNATPSFLKAEDSRGGFVSRLKEFNVWNIIAGIYFPKDKSPAECTVEDYSSAKRLFLWDLYSLMQDAKDLTKKLYKKNFAVLAAESPRLSVDASQRLVCKFKNSLPPDGESAARSAIIGKMIETWKNYISLNTNNGINTALTSNNVVSIESCIMNVLNNFLNPQFNEILRTYAITRDKFVTTEKGTLYNESSLTLDSRGADDDITAEDNAFITESMILLRQLDLQIFCDTYTRTTEESKTENSKCKFSILEWKCMQDLSPYLRDSQQICINFGESKNSFLEKSTKFTKKAWEFSPIATQAFLTNQRVVVSQKYQKHTEYYKNFLNTAYRCYLSIKNGETNSWDKLFSYCVVNESGVRNSFLTLGVDFKRADDLKRCSFSKGENCKYTVNYSGVSYEFSLEEAEFIKEFNGSSIKFNYFPTNQGLSKVNSLFEAFERLEKLKSILAKRKIALVDLCILYFMDYNSCFDYKGLIRAGVYTWSNATKEALANENLTPVSSSVSRFDLQLVRGKVLHHGHSDEDSRGDESQSLTGSEVINTDEVYDVKAVTRATVARILELAFPISFSKGRIVRGYSSIPPLQEFLSGITTYKAKQILGLILMLCRDCSIYSVPESLSSQDKRLISLFKVGGIIGKNDEDKAVSLVGVRKLLTRQLKTKNLLIDDIDVVFNNTWGEEEIATEFINGYNSRGRVVKSESYENWSKNPLAKRYSLKYALKRSRLNQSASETIDRRSVTCEPETVFVFSNLGEMLFCEGRNQETLNYCLLSDEIVAKNRELLDSRRLRIPELFVKAAKVFENCVRNNECFTFKGRSLKCALAFDYRNESGRSLSGARPLLELVPNQEENEEPSTLRAELDRGLRELENRYGSQAIRKEFKASYLSLVSLPEAEKVYSYRGYKSSGEFVAETLRELPLHSIVLAYYWAREFNLFVKCKSNSRLMNCLNQCFDYETSSKPVVSKGELQSLEGMDLKALTNYVFDHSRFEKFLLWCRYLSLYGRELTASVGSRGESISLDFLAIESATFRNCYAVPKCLLKNVDTNVFYYFFYPLFMLINSYPSLKNVPNPSLNEKKFPEEMKYRDKVKLIGEEYAKGEFSEEDIRSKVFKVLKENDNPTEGTLREVKQYYDVCSTIARKMDLKFKKNARAKIIVNSFDLFSLVIEIPHLMGLLEHKVKDSRGGEKAVDEVRGTLEFIGGEFDIDSSLNRLFSNGNANDGEKFEKVLPQEKIQVDHLLRKSSFFGETDSTVTDYRFSEEFYEFFAECYGELLKLQMLGKFAIMADNYRTVSSHRRMINSREASSIVSPELRNCLWSSQLQSSVTLYGPSSSISYSVAGQETLDFLYRIKDNEGTLSKEDIKKLDEAFFFYHDNNSSLFSANNDKYFQIQLNVLFDALKYREAVRTLGENLTEYRSTLTPVNYSEPLDTVMEKYKSFIKSYLDSRGVQSSLRNFNRSTELASLLSMCELTPITNTEVERSTGLLLKNGSYVGSANSTKNYSLGGVRLVSDEEGGNVTFYQSHYFLHESGAVIAVNECYFTDDDIVKKTESIDEVVKRIDNYARVLNEIQEMPSNKEEFAVQFNRIINKTSIVASAEEKDERPRTLGEFVRKSNDSESEEYSEINFSFTSYRECVEDLMNKKERKLEELRKLQEDSGKLRGNHVQTMGYSEHFSIVCSIVTSLESTEHILQRYIP